MRTPDPAFDFDADPDPVSHSDEDPDPTSQNDADPDPQHFNNFNFHVNYPRNRLPNRFNRQSNQAKPAKW
jgi:hypothetical protein